MNIIHQGPRFRLVEHRGQWTLYRQRRPGIWKPIEMTEEAYLALAEIGANLGRKIELNKNLMDIPGRFDNRGKYPVIEEKDA